MAKTTDERLDDLIRLMERNSGRSTTSSSSSSEKSTPINLDTKGLETAITTTADVFKNVKQSVSESQDMYHSLSKAGMSFSGDLFAMGNAAVGMRMSTKEMEESFLNFQKDGIIKGFGTNLTNSAEGFAKASKHFFDNNSEAADSLRRMGYTTKDINEVMALQGVTLRGKFKDDQEMASVAADNAKNLATEMDSLSKLTGKSRQEQAELMKKQQADMQFEAAIRLKTQGMSAKEAADFEANARQQLKDATILGQGQMFKEIFATGQIMTKEAATQAAINREQATAATNMAKTAADRTLTAAQREEKGNEYRRELMAASTKDMNDKTKLQFAAMGDAGGAVSKVMMDQYGKQVDMNRVIEKVAAQNNLNLKSQEDYRKAVEMAEKEVTAAQSGQRKNEKGQYEQVDASSRALTSFQGRLGDAASVMNEKFTQPIQGQVNKALGALAEGAFSASGNLGGIINQRAQGTTVSQKLKSEIDTGAEKGFKDSHGVIQSLGAANKAAHEMVNDTIPKAKKLADDAVDTLKEKAQTRTTNHRATGSIGEAGKLIEDFGSGTLMELHGKETVLTEDQFKNMAKGMQYTGMKNQAEAYQQTASMKLDQMKKDIISFSASNMSKSEAKSQAATAAAAKSSLSSSGDNKPEIDRRALKFDQFGMPIAGGIKSKTAEMSQEVQKKEEEKKAAASNVEDQKKGIAAGKPATAEEKKPDAAKPLPTASKDSSLSDVVASLNQLNSKVSQLIEVQKDIGQRQIKAVKSNSKDVYNQ